MLIIVLRYWASFILVNGSFNTYQILNSIYGYHGIEIKFHSEKNRPIAFLHGCICPLLSIQSLRHQQTDISLELPINCTHQTLSPLDKVKFSTLPAKLTLNHGSWKLIFSDVYWYCTKYELRVNKRFHWRLNIVECGDVGENGLKIILGHGRSFHICCGTEWELLLLSIAHNALTRCVMETSVVSCKYVLHACKFC